MTTTTLPMPTLRRERAAITDAYGNARLPASAHDAAPQRVDKIPYGRFRNVYLYITEACQLRCEHCYMGERLERALKMPYGAVMNTLTTWRRMGGSKLTILGGEPTLHPDYIPIIRNARALGYEHVITTSNGLGPAAKRFAQMQPEDFSYVQISLDGGSASSHDRVRGKGTFDQALSTVASLCKRGFDTRIICTVNRANLGDCLNLLGIADELGVSLVKSHVFSVIGSGHGAAEWGIAPVEWISFYERLEQVAPRATAHGCGTSRLTPAPSGWPGTPPMATGAASAGPWTGSRSSRTGEPTCARSCSTPTCTSRTWSTARWSSTRAPTSSTCSHACCTRQAAARARW